MEQSDNGSAYDLMRYRIETAKNDLHLADIMMEKEEYRGRITERIMRFIMQYRPSMLWMEKHIKGTRIHWQISIKTM